MNYNEERELIEKYLNDNCTQQQKEIVESWYNNHVQQLPDLLETPDYTHEKETIWQAISVSNAQLSNKKNNGIKIKSFPFVRIAIAASILMALGIGFWMHANYQQKFSGNNRYGSDIAPGSNQATLTLGNGKKINLSHAGKGEIASLQGITIRKTADGQIVYQVAASRSKSALIEYNTVSTPRGGQFEVHLPDGSKVWLNAASSLKFPSAFIPNQNRQVELSGEAYFEVAKNKAAPFMVKTIKQVVRVVGTHFNIDSYADEPSVKTTLLEGSVKVSSAEHGKNAIAQNTILKPGQQSLLASGAPIKVANVDADDAIAWKQGIFLFEGDSLEDIMQRVSRWYNVTVEFQNPDTKKIKFSGAVSRFATVSHVLKKLELVGDVSFSIENNKIIVLEKH